jgi:hypothetical protein
MAGDPDLYLTLKDHLDFPDNGEPLCIAGNVFGAFWVDP